MEAPRSKSYDGPSGIGRDSNWLTNEDLVEGKDVAVTIEDVRLYPEVKFEGGRAKQNVLGLKFKGKERVLLLNATNRKKLNKAFGNIVKAWKGQTVTLYVTETQMAGETVKCVRIRDARARAATAAEDFLLGSDEPAAMTDEKPATEYGDANGHDTPEAAFDRACELLNVSDAEKAALLSRVKGDFDAAHRDLQAMADAQARQS